MRKIFLVISALSLTGCADLSAVRKVSTQLVTASNAWSGPHAEYLAVCRRNDALAVPRSIDGVCVQSEKATTGLNAATKVLTNYFSAIAAAADETSFTADTGLSELGASIEGIPGADATKVKAATSLGKYLANLYMRQKREKAIAELIDQGADDAISTIDMLTESAATQLEKSLGDERSSLTRAYLGLVDSGLTPEFCKDGPKLRDFTHSRPLNTDGSGPLLHNPAYLYAVEYCQHIALNQKKSDMVKAYSASLATSRQALLDLKSGKAKLTSKDMATLLQKEIKALEKQIAGINEAF